MGSVEPILRAEMAKKVFKARMTHPVQLLDRDGRTRMNLANDSL
jgi:hypothetical protein